MHAIEVKPKPAAPKYSQLRRKDRNPRRVPVRCLIKAEAIGVNFVDTYFRSGQYPHELPFVLGAEVAGTVEAVGDGVIATPGRRQRRHRRRYRRIR